MENQEKQPTKTPEQINKEKLRRAISNRPESDWRYYDYDYSAENFAGWGTPEASSSNQTNTGDTVTSASEQPPEKPYKSRPEYSQNGEFLRTHDDIGAKVIPDTRRLTNKFEDSKIGVTNESEVRQESSSVQEDEPPFFEDGSSPSVLVKFPTNMTRLSPLFPMSKRDRAKRPYEKICLENSWGSITLEGQRLSIDDETTLLILLILAKKSKFKSLWTTRYKLLGIDGRARSTDTYKALWASIERLARTYVKIQLKNKDGKVELEMGGAIIAWWEKRIKPDGSKRIHIVLNPYFAKMVEKGRITRLDLELRKQIKTDTAKALYRFYDGQKKFYNFKKTGYPLMVLAHAINLKIEGVKPHLIRKKIKTALNELELRGYLTWEITKNDYVMVKKKGIK
jgi:hypothetical protein